jgi:RNA polymerase sigma-70 factor (ECF subfamily)
MNAAYDHLAQRKRRQEAEDALRDHPAPECRHPERALLGAELRGEVTAALAALSPKLRAAIVLTGLQQRSVAEAAKIEGCLTATMYWRVHEARRLLRRRLEGYLSP